MDDLSLTALLNKTREDAQTEATTRIAALEAEVARLTEALTRLTDPKLVPSHGDPVVLRDYARAALVKP